jgi:hypothetical protein
MALKIFGEVETMVVRPEPNGSPRKSLRRAVRIFAVERIRALNVLRNRFTVPADFDVQDDLRHALGILRGELVTVKVVFARSVACYITERLWHPSQKFRELDRASMWSAER